MSRPFTDKGYAILTDEEHGAEIERLYIEEHFSMMEIAATLKSTDGRVRRVLDIRKVPIRSPGAALKWRIDFCALAKEYEKCMDVQRMASKHGVRSATMVRWLREAGVVFTEPRQSPEGDKWPGYPMIGVEEMERKK